MQKDTSLDVLPAASRVFASGRGAGLDGLAFANSALKARTASAICLLGVDSLVTGRRLRRLSNRGELARAGFTPGEAAAAILIVPRLDAGSMAVIAGVGAAEEPSVVNREMPNLGKGFSSAIERAASDAGLSASPFACLVHDLLATPPDCEELLWAKSCSTLSTPAQMSVVSPLSSVGYAGAATGVLSLLTLAFLIDKGAVAGPGLCLFSTDDARRGAAVLVPSPRSRDAERRSHG
jgi:3-oxoacyl-[acyl-carrier-protein] synthase-1